MRGRMENYSKAREKILGTGVDMSGLLKLTRTCKKKTYRGTGYVSSSQNFQRKSGLEITVLEGMLKFDSVEINPVH